MFIARVRHVLRDAIAGVPGSRTVITPNLFNLQAFDVESIEGTDDGPVCVLYDGTLHGLFETAYLRFPGTRGLPALRKEPGISGMYRVRARIAWVDHRPQAAGAATPVQADEGVSAHTDSKSRLTAVI